MSVTAGRRTSGARLCQRRQSATVTVPVKAFTCPNAEMTEHLMQAMKPEQFPEIVYKVEKYEIAGAQAQATGTMTIQGKSQPLRLPVG